MNFFELAPAYGRDYRNAAAAKADWLADKDWNGDYQLGFKPVNRTDLRRAFPGGFSVTLRYDRNRKLTVVTEKGGK